MITVSKFLECVRENADRVTHYESGGDGSGGGCDCIGLIIGALRLAGEKWTGTHGSNWAARNAIREPWPYKIMGESDLRPGMIVFKALSMGETGYNLPDYYSGSVTQLDYYHVGVVMGVGPLTIMHCTKSAAQDIDGITEDHNLGKWMYYGELKQVDYGGQEDQGGILYYAEVVADNGYPVKLRPQPSTDKEEICKVPLHTVIAVLDDSIGGWDKVEYAGIIGYMMSSFLRPVNGSDSSNGEAVVEPSRGESVGAGDAVTVSRDDLAAQRRKLNDVSAWIDTQLAR